MTLDDIASLCKGILADADSAPQGTEAEKAYNDGWRACARAILGEIQSPKKETEPDGQQN